MASAHCKTVVLISGNGTNLQALIDASPHSNFEIEAVISNKADAFGLERATQANIPTEVVEHKQFAERAEFDRALQATIDTFEPDLLVLAGFMRILGSEFTAHYAGRMLNTHPSLLPKFPGINTHQRAIDAGETEHGVSIHFVTKELDGGPVIAQERVSIANDDTANSLADKVLQKEHVLYPTVVSWYAAGRLRLDDNSALLDGKVLPAGGVSVSLGQG